MQRDGAYCAPPLFSSSKLGHSDEYVTSKIISFVASGHFNVTDVWHVKPDCNASKWIRFKIEDKK